MSSKPDVRPNVEGHPDAQRRASHLDPVEALTRQLFDNRGGNDLYDDMTLIVGALEMHGQDVERGRANNEPETFRWRVNTANAIRLRKERKQTLEEIRTLMFECRADAEKIIKAEQLKAQQAAAKTPEPKQAAPATPASEAAPGPNPKPTVGTEVAQQAPKHTGK